MSTDVFRFVSSSMVMRSIFFAPKVLMSSSYVLRFCGRLKLPLQPRLSRAWLLNVSFLRTVLEMEVGHVRAEAQSVVKPAVPSSVRGV